MLGFHGSGGNTVMWGYPWNHGSKTSNIHSDSSNLPTVLQNSLSNVEVDLPHLILLMQYFSPVFGSCSRDKNYQDMDTAGQERSCNIGNNSSTIYTENKVNFQSTWAS
jgi:hypothetical protein